MRTLPRHSGVFAFAAIAIGAGLLLGFAGWLEPHRTVEFSGLILAAILTSALAMQQSTTEDRRHMPPSFVIDFTSLLLFGPHPTMLVAAAGTITQGLADSQRAHPPRRMLSNAATVMVATQAAGFAHQALGGTMGHFMWPWQGAADRGCRRRVLLRQERVGGGHRAALRETADQPIVAEERSPRAVRATSSGPASPWGSSR